MRAPLAGARRPAMLPVALAALAVALLFGPSASGSENDRFPVQLVRVNVPTQADRDRLTSLGLDLTEHAGHAYVEAVLHTPADASRLAGAGFTWTVSIPDLGLREKRNQELNAAYAAATELSPLPSGRDTYRTLADYNADLRRLAAVNPSTVRLFSLSRPSVEGREILGIEISHDVASKTDGKPAFLMMGLHHAREWPSGEHAMEFGFDLVRGVNVGDARITGLLKKVRVLVVPVVNPDGFEQSRKWGDLVDIREVDNGGTVTILGNPGNAYKRKNCRVADGQATPPGGCEVSEPRRLRHRRRPEPELRRPLGRAGRVEPRRRPDLPRPRAVLGAGDEGGAGARLLAPRDDADHEPHLLATSSCARRASAPPARPHDEAAMKALGARMTAQNGYRNIHGWQLYDTTGTTEDWSYNATGGYGYTFEIGPNEFHPPFPEVIDEYLGAGIYAGKGNREAYLLALENAADPKHHSVVSGQGARRGRAAAEQGLLDLDHHRRARRRTTSSPRSSCPRTAATRGTSTRPRGPR